MIEIELDVFENYRPKLIQYASSLFRNRGFCDREGELEAYSEDVVQQAYLRFHKWGVKDRYVSFLHLENFLIGVVYKEFLQAVDINRRGAQYILYKANPNGEKFKEEFRQLDVTKHIKPTQDEFDFISSFKNELTEVEVKVVDLLLEGYSQKEVAEKLGINVGTLRCVQMKNIRKKYNIWDGE